MDKEINRIRINRLYSESNIFDEIIFHDGINLILGEKYDNATITGRKTNGVGKSMSIEFLDFCFLNDYKNSRINKIPESVVPMEENIILDLEIGHERITIKRNRKNESMPLLIRNGKSVTFDKLTDARNYLSELIFNKLNGKSVPSFRNILSILMRDERSEFIDILKCHELTKSIPIDLTAHLYMLGIEIESYQKTIKTIKEIENITKVITRNKNELTEGKTKKIADVQAELNSLDDELEKMELAIENFKSNEAYDSIEKDLLELEDNLDKLRKRQKVLRHEYDKIKRLPKPEEIDDVEIELVYNQFKSDLGSAIVKSLNEVVGFKNQVEEFQRMLINQKAYEVEAQLNEIADRIRILDDEYSEKLKIIDTKGVLQNLKVSLRIYQNKKDESAHTKYLFDEYENNTKQKKNLALRKSQEIMEIDDLLEKNKSNIKGFIATILDIHENIMGNKECSFSVQTINKARIKVPVDISMRIFDDGSRSVNRTKVFIYDMALLFNDHTRIRHPLFLVHDNIFDVDQDTLVQCLNYLKKQEEKYQEFQYILTLNRDKIENEEKAKLVKLDVNAKVVAAFTKKDKFLKKDYQEK
ncbi:uncharacterized protein YydD (DUF2326 family) [Acetoanaerobium pronyense]|uniref:Uncharacterized protein YydD (DUF2326 family) n=1 Tax=Acetoanaerobium pronyense TaxID=1482736 RepID=A0ABS4KMR5_9FIRM|nr:DUF2326 domain-containing protein [Acetoanaerobium pronyense]MBP2029065.1 uncharacterized protein YydD (DUF2326 family) [Acetoanaerobium pronyense]